MLKGSKGYVVVRALASHKCSPGSNTANTRRHRAIGGLNCCCFGSTILCPKTFSFRYWSDHIFLPSIGSKSIPIRPGMVNEKSLCEVLLPLDGYFIITEGNKLHCASLDPRHINNSWISFIPLDIYYALANVWNLESKLKCARKLTSAKLSLLAKCVMTSYSPFLFFILRLYTS